MGERGQRRGETKTRRGLTSRGCGGGEVVRLGRGWEDERAFDSALIYWARGVEAPPPITGFFRWIPELLCQHWLTPGGGGRPGVSHHPGIGSLISQNPYCRGVMLQSTVNASDCFRQGASRLAIAKIQTQTGGFKLLIIVIQCVYAKPRS